MIGLVTQHARDAVAAAEALKGARYREVENADGSTRHIPARMGTAPLLAAHDPDGEDEAEAKDENGAFKGEFTPRATLTVQGSGPVTQALASHVYAAQHHARMPHHLASLQTTEAPAPAGPTFEPGTASVQAQNHRAPTHAFPQVHAPGQVPFHPAPINTGSQR
ncbi:hypothetical protein [Streptomyces sp. B1-3]|uniref:hypothetical protein n=1 Tax=Streptomyces sp. B1-3 TaxID=3141453 RepID=UPI003D2688EB